jgi:hypothetical protein
MASCDSPISQDHTFLLVVTRSQTHGVQSGFHCTINIGSSLAKAFVAFRARTFLAELPVFDRILFKNRI